MGLHELPDVVQHHQAGALARGQGKEEQPEVGSS